MTTNKKKTKTTSTTAPKKGGFGRWRTKTRTIFQAKMMMMMKAEMVDDLESRRHHHPERRRKKNISASFSKTRATPRSASLSASSSSEDENTNTNYNNSSSSSENTTRTNNNENNNTTNNDEFILYGSQGSRSPLINWYLYEKEVQFELKEPRDVSNPHPFGQVPALRHKENVELFESGAILLYLADKCGELKSDEAKANAYSWVLWANASLDPICFKEDINGRVIDTGIKNETKGMRRLDDVLSKREWLSGDQFGVADVAVAAYLLYVPQFFQGVSFKRWPNVAKFMGRCCSRDSYAKAFGPRVQSYLIGELMKDVDGN
jgi:glutathione S-transferase/alpha,alpha-trehalase